MSISTELQRIKTNISDSYTAAASKGATIPANQSGDNLATTIDSIVPAGVNPQNRTVYESGTFTYENTQTTYRCYSLPDYISTNDKVFVKEPVDVGSTIYDSILDSDTGNYIPNFTRIIGPVQIVLNSGDSIEIYSHWANRESANDITFNYNYDSLNSVTVNTDDIVCMRPTKSSINLSCLSIAPSAFYNDRVIETVVSNALSISTNAFSNCIHLSSVTLTDYEGASLTQNGDLINDQDGAYAFSYSPITYFSAPKLKIMSHGFLTLNDYSNMTVLNLPSFIGMTYGSAIGDSWAEAGSGNTSYEVLKRFNINIEDFECMGSGFGSILEQYIADVNNNITDTLTFNHLRYIGRAFTETSGVGRNLLDNITSFIVPNLQRISEDCNFDLPITTIDLPNIVTIDNNAFKTNTLTTINIGSTIDEIYSSAFNNLSNITINIDLPAPDAGDTSWKANAPWGASNAIVNWTGSL